MRRNLVITVAIVMALGLMIPTSVILLNYHPQSNLPPIYATDGSITNNWSYDFSNASSVNSPIYYGGYSNATFWEPGYLNSTFSTKLGAFAYEDKTTTDERTGMSSVAYGIELNITGDLRLSHLPSKVQVTYGTDAFVAAAFDGRVLNYSTSLGYLQPTNVSLSWELQTYNFSVDLLNESHYNGSNTYHFAFTAYFPIDIIPPSYNIPFSVDINVSLIGLSKPVYSSITLNLDDVGSSVQVIPKYSTLSEPISNVVLQASNSQGNNVPATPVGVEYYVPVTVTNSQSQSSSIIAWINDGGCVDPAS